jgi:hypothetical protein
MYRPNSMRHGSQMAPEASESPSPSSRSLTARSKREVLGKQTEEGRLYLYVPGARGRKFRSLRRGARGRTVRPAAAAPRARWSSSPSSDNFLPLPHAHRYASNSTYAAGMDAGCPPPASRCRLSPNMVRLFCHFSHIGADDRWGQVCCAPSGPVQALAQVRPPASPSLTGSRATRSY